MTAGVRGSDRGGFTLVELLLVVVIIGVLVQIFVPNYRNMIMRARAVEAMADVDVVESAAREYNAQSFAWPAETATGETPPELIPYLPDGFAFDGAEGYRLDWENLPLPGGLPGDPRTTRVLGIGIVVDEARLGTAIVDVFGEAGWYNVGNAYVFVIDRQ